MTSKYCILEEEGKEPVKVYFKELRGAKELRKDLHDLNWAEQAKLDRADSINKSHAKKMKNTHTLGEIRKKVNDGEELSYEDSYKLKCAEAKNKYYNNNIKKKPGVEDKNLEQVKDDLEKNKYVSPRDKYRIYEQKYYNKNLEESLAEGKREIDDVKYDMGQGVPVKKHDELRAIRSMRYYEIKNNKK